MKSAIYFLMVSFALMAQASESRQVPDREYSLTVELQIERSAVTGLLRFPVRSGEREDLSIGNLSVHGISVNGKTVSPTTREGVLTFVPQEPGTAEVRYEGVFTGGEPIGNKNYGVVSSVIDSRGVSLTGLWHPRPAGLSRWKLSVTLPRGFEAVSEAESAVRSETGGKSVFTFDFPHPIDSLSLVASDRFRVFRERAGNVELLGYFFQDDSGLAATYLEYARNYLTLYEKMLTPYPFKRFVVVENFLATGYSMPTFTLLGQDVVRLPFIVETSLGHEILHQWFGNSVFVDSSQGNWAEGLTSYLADHWYDELKGKGWEHRKQLLVNYGAYVNERNDFPLRDFRSRMDLASRSVGYGKAAMIFHLLRKQAGDEKFFEALRGFIRDRCFQEGSWADIRAAFERETGRDLKGYFTEWLDRKGLPELGVENLSMKRKGSSFEISFDVTKKNTVLSVELPVLISLLRGGEKKEKLTIDGERKQVSLVVDEEPSRIVIDGDYDLLRKLTAEETPPVIAAVTGAEKPLVVSPRSGRDRYDAVIKGFSEKDDQTRLPDTIRDSDLRTAALVVLDRDNPVAERLFGAVDLPKDGFSIEVRKNPWNESLPVAILQSVSAEETDAAFKKLYHYGKYSSLAFEKGKNRSKNIASSERGLILQLRGEPQVVEMRSIKGFSAIVDGVADKRIVYVGEYHDLFSHHNIQVEVIKALYNRDRSLAVGMEMFQRPSQKALDDYISGAIGEREFLERSEYFKRWDMDYNLYKPILDFCRLNRIPVVALNLQREITEKVSKSGMDSLTAEERKELPREADFSDEDYRDRLQETFAQHRSQNGGERSFDFFLQAQVLWDETMAESVADYLRKNPGQRMVVVAGSGHIARGSGIPKRVFRRNGASYSIVLNDGNLGPGMADYLIFPQPLDGLTAPRLKVSLKEEGERLIVTDFAKDSPAKTAGLRKGDALIAVDGKPVGAVMDLKLALHYKNKGDVILVTVERKRFLFGEQVMTYEVKL